MGEIEMRYINRKSLIYKTGVEYGDYTMNHVQGCSHGCKYPCYAFMLAKRFGKVKTYNEWCEPKIVKNTLELLNVELPKFKDKIDTLHLCFTTDPFMYDNKEIQDLSVESLKLIEKYGVKASVLTKGTFPQEVLKLSKANLYGITLISLNESFREEMEPGSAPYLERIDSLREIHENGGYTWVSIEPYPTPNFINQSLYEILEKVSFVDKIIFGRLNYNKKVSEYKGYKEFFNKCSYEVIDYCNKNNIEVYIKNGTITEIDK